MADVYWAIIWTAGKIGCRGRQHLNIVVLEKPAKAERFSFPPGVEIYNSSSTSARGYRSRKELRLGARVKAAAKVEIRQSREDITLVFAATHHYTRGKSSEKFPESHQESSFWGLWIWVFFFKLQFPLGKL